MHIATQVRLDTYNTFGVLCQADRLVRVSQINELDGLRHANIFAAPHLILGGGSNVLFRSRFEGTVILNRLEGKQVVGSLGSNHIIVQFGAGERWHECVKWCIDQGFGGIENLALIPGTAGAAPLQNIGAYGVEIKDVFHSLDAYEKSTGQIHVFERESCAFGYRESVFKGSLRNRFLITAVRLMLTSGQHQLRLDYGDIQRVLAQENVAHPTIAHVAKAVESIRREKLPDPAYLGNAGSFFKNPIVAKGLADKLLQTNPTMPVYESGHDGGLRKLAAGWLIEQCGWKGKRVGQVGVHDRQALVIVNYGGATGEEIWALAQQVQASVRQRFGILLEPEVNIL
ncbi:MAG: UDP-N-acetylmuramate dehydrogenase [Bacteroidetes bacterium]|nr:UDP-N-acetylmuramate dehydrogenase [Bacteroidota bacterium]